MKLALVGDIGGTNARFALWKNQQLESVQVLATADHASSEEAISLYLSGLGLAPGSIGSVCLSVAGPVSGDEFKFTNNHWRLSRTAFCKTLQVEQLLLGTEVGQRDVFTQRVRADNPIAIELVGYSTGLIDITSIGDIGISGFNLRHTRCGIGRELDRDRVKIRRIAPVIGEGFQAHIGTLLEGIDHVRAGANRGFLEPF